jgi:hypothetical protein
MKHPVALAAILLFSSAVLAAQDPATSQEPVPPGEAEAVAACLKCSDALKRELDKCGSESCRAKARTRADACAAKIGQCDLDLVKEPAPDPQPAKPKS